MKTLGQEEQKILSQLEERIGEIRQWSHKQLKDEIAAHVNKAGCCNESWQVHYSVEAILEILQPQIWYSGLSKDEIKYISSWSWVAFFGGMIYTIGSRLYAQTFGFFIPIYNIYLHYYLGKNGRRLSYLKGWKSYSEFRKRQRVLDWFFWILFVIFFGINGWGVMLLIFKST